MSGKKGQSAMEYLMTYGWAILVVMVVGIAMWRLGIFNMGPTTMTFTGFAKIKPQLSGTGFNATGNFNGVFTNGVGTTITVKDVNITKGANTCAISDKADSRDFIKSGKNTVTGDQIASNPPRVPAGENFQVHIDDGNCGITGASNEIYVLKVAIKYDVTVGNTVTSHSEVGTIRGPFER